MKKNSISRFSTCFALVVAAGFLRGEYVFDEDFTLLDAFGRPYAIEVEKNSHYSHAHWKMLDGEYTILVSGNRHWLTTPTLADFSLDFKCSAECVVPHEKDKVAFEVYFRRDRDDGGGSVLRFERSNAKKLITVSLDGKLLASRQSSSRDDFRNLSVHLEVEGEKGRLKSGDIETSFDVKPGRGRIAFDIVSGGSAKMSLSRVKLVSAESPAQQPFLRRKVELPAVQGMQEKLYYDVTFFRCAGGGMSVSCELSGGVASRGERIRTGGTEWASAIERLTSPYVKIIGADGGERKIYLWNGMRQFVDENVSKRYVGKNPKPWPYVRQFHLLSPVEPVFIAAGYEYAICNPWRFAANGPYERVVSADGKDVYLGAAVEKDAVVVKVSSPEDKRIAGMIPTDLPRYQDALDHARREHYFFESERAKFTVDVFFRKEVWQEQEIDVKISLADVYGRAGTARAVVEGLAGAPETLPNGLVRVRRNVRVDGKLGIGVWKLLVDVKAGPMPSSRSTEIFEVLGDDPDSLSPPLASGLPTFVCMPSELKYFEQMAFDPWGAFGGVGHYYSIDNRYPKVGNHLQIWRVLPLYRRKWWCWNRRRNSDDIDMYNDYTKQLMLHSEVFGGYDNRRHNLARYELGARWHYIDDQLKMMRDYVVQRKPNLARITPARANALVASGSMPSFEDIKEIFDSGWDEYKAFCKPRIEANEKVFTEHLLSIKPTIGFATYGPHAFYLTHYKSAYALEYAGYPIEKDPRVRANGSFWVFEEYHHSCDYPLHRPSLFVATYDYHFGYGRRIFPEIYYSGWSRCLDGAVYNAHPMSRTQLAFTHQRRIAYRYVYGTPRFKNGRYGFWTDDGFHARNPEREAMEEFVYAWKNVVENRPARPPRAAFIAVDFDLLRRHGEYFETETNTRFGDGSEHVDICNTGEEALAYAHDRCIVNGYSTPVVCSAADFDAITPAMADFVALPPIEKGTPQKVLDSIRRMHERGVNLLATEAVCGLEDMFGVEPDPKGFSKVGRIGTEVFSHKMSQARYRAAGSKVALFGASSKKDAADIPLVFMKENAAARAVLVNVPPTVVRRSTFRNVYHWGQESLSGEMMRAYRDVIAWLSPNPEVKADGALATGAFSKNGDFVVVVSDESPIYNDSEKYPKMVKLTVRQQGIGNLKMTADTPYSVISRADDEISLRIPLNKDTAYFLRWSRGGEKAPDTK